MRGGGGERNPISGQDMKIFTKTKKISVHVCECNVDKQKILVKNTYQVVNSQCPSQLGNGIWKDGKYDGGISALTVPTSALFELLHLAYNLASFGYLIKIKFKKEKLSEPIPQNKGKHCFNCMCIDTY